VTMLAAPEDSSARRGGSWTPASLFGERLIARLEAEAGLEFEIVER